MNEKMLFGGFVIGVVAVLQGIAWLGGHNGSVFAFTSLVIGSVAGAVLGFRFSTAEKPKS